jgi:hypothetical protein
MVRHVNIKFCKYLQVVFKLLVTSEAELSLYHLDLGGENSTGRCKIIDTSCKETNRKCFHKQVPGNHRILKQPLTWCSGQQTSPRCRWLPVPPFGLSNHSQQF